MTELFEPLTLRGTEIRQSHLARPDVPVLLRSRRRNARTLASRPPRLPALRADSDSSSPKPPQSSPKGRISPQDAGIWNDDQAESWSAVVDFVHSQGSVIGIQLAHAGRKASTYRPFTGEPKGSVPESDGGWPTARCQPHRVSEARRTGGDDEADDIAEVVAAFAAAARRSIDAGFDLVELHAAHGYLLHSFLSPLSNQRGDEYGGDLAGRSRLLHEVYAAVRAEVGDKVPVFVRISASEWTDGGFDIAEAAEVSRALSEVGVDLIDVSSGGNYPVRIPIGPGYQVSLAAAIRAEGALAGAVGLITDPKQAETILSTGQADAIFMARAALREPSWPQRAAHVLGVEPGPYPPQYTRGAW
jgi:2,4-dienoyl-CoA reductase-like NADH-dependent reductase (Old Yellow Enzyme family)